jgi:hypothetical protein
MFLVNVMKTKSTVMPAAFIVFTGLLLAMASPLSNNNAFAADTNKPNSTSLKGALTSIQNDDDGKRAWLISGVFKMGNYGNTNNVPPTFGATFYMVKLHGNSSHTHTISDFKLIGAPTTSNNSTIIKGNSTITMEGGPVKDVPTTLKIYNKSTISIALDRDKVMDHFGNTPIYGTHHLVCVEIPENCQ